MPKPTEKPNFTEEFIRRRATTIYWESVYVRDTCACAINWLARARHWAKINRRKKLEAELAARIDSLAIDSLMLEA